MLFGKFHGWSALAPETRAPWGEGQPALDNQNFNHVHQPFSYHSQFVKQCQTSVHCLVGMRIRDWGLIYLFLFPGSYILYLKYSIYLLGARKRVLMPHRFLYDIVSSAHKTSMCLGKKGTDPPCTSYHRGCRLPGWQVSIGQAAPDTLRSGAELWEQRQNFLQMKWFRCWTQWDTTTNSWHKPTLFIQHLVKGFGTRPVHVKRCGEQKAHVFWSIEDKNRPKGWCRIFAISDVWHLRASCETHQLLAGQRVEPPLIQVHIDHGGAVLKWAEGINDKVGPIEAAAVH